MSSNTQRKKPLPTRQELGDLIRSRVQHADDLLMASIKLPDGHAWRKLDGRLTFWEGCPVLSTNSMGISLYIDRLPVPGMTGEQICGDPATIHAEIRVFHPGVEYREGRAVRVYRDRLVDGLSATLWVKSGPLYWKDLKSHLVDKERFVYADTIEALCAESVARVTTALERATRWIAQRNVATAEVACARSTDTSKATRPT